MTTEEILKRAIEKAVNNGYRYTFDEVTEFKAGRYNGIIFSHEFAKAFWGEEEIEWEVHCEPLDRGYDCYEPTHAPAWRYHLQQMVLEEDKIRYLEKFL